MKFVTLNTKVLNTNLLLCLIDTSFVFKYSVFAKIAQMTESIPLRLIIISSMRR